MTYKFTESAEKAIQYANEITLKLGHNYIGSEHILYGLVKEKTGISNKVLEEQGIVADKVENEIKKIMGETLVKTKKILGFTPRTKRILENASAEAKKVASNYIGTEHILVGIMREEDSIAIRILINLSVDLKKIYDNVLKVINESIAEEKQLKNRVQNNEKDRAYSETPTLNQYGVDICENVRKGLIDPIIGRKNEIERVIQILTRRTKNNPCLIGEPGVRKNSNSRRISEQNRKYGSTTNAKR